MTDLRVTYDAEANAAYVYFTDPQVRFRKVAHMYPCDPDKVDGMINLDFDEDMRLLGIEVLDARESLPQYLLDAAEPLNRGNA
ncbi:DUF2283 domain-containing protein [Streptomyces sp. NPDC048338]|uniref:DUF2283 domain-containing protein n=1 Tax=Streptomyces sp. NPDC048338 TaxID=3365536 RepID=UPI003712BF5C